MPLYTFVLTYRNQTKVIQESKSNFRGWMGQVVARAFPKEEKIIGQSVWAIDPKPVENLKGVWQGGTQIAGIELAVTIIGTKR